MMIIKYCNSRAFYINSKIFKALFSFQGLSRSWKMGTFCQDFQGHTATMIKDVI